MTIEQAISVARQYRARLECYGITPERAPQQYSLAMMSPDEQMAHCLWLLHDMEELATNPTKLSKIMRHLAFAQAILSQLGTFTFEELRAHNNFRSTVT